MPQPFAKNKRKFDRVVGENQNRPGTTHGYVVRNNLAETDGKSPSEFGESPCTLA